MICAVQEDLYPIISYEKHRFPEKGTAGEQEREIGYVLTSYLKHAELLLNYRDCIPFLKEREEREAPSFSAHANMVEY